MATRNLLHKSKLGDFEAFLEKKGYMILSTSKNPFEVLRAKKESDTVLVYMKAGSLEHLSFMDKDHELVREFIKFQKTTTKADRIRSMTDEELAVIIMCPHEIDPSMCISEHNCIKCTLEWLRSPAEEGDEK